MTRKEIYEKLDAIASTVNENSSKEELDVANNTAEKLLEDKCHIITVHAPTLDDNLHPAFELLNMECPNKKDGKCHNCDNFVTIKSEDGTIFAFQSFRGYCLKEENE